MKKKSREIVKALIKLSPTVEEADKIIIENYGFKSIEEKVAFLREIFDISVVGHEKDSPDEMIYYAMLNAIIHHI